MAQWAKAAFSFSLLAVCAARPKPRFANNPYTLLRKVLTKVERTAFGEGIALGVLSANLFVEAVTPREAIAAVDRLDRVGARAKPCRNTAVHEPWVANILVLPVGELPEPSAKQTLGVASSRIGLCELLEDARRKVGGQKTLTFEFPRALLFAAPLITLRRFHRVYLRTMTEASCCTRQRAPPKRRVQSGERTSCSATRASWVRVPLSDA
jgi:hypothetical protein